jgi:hypothetical protein
MQRSASAPGKVLVCLVCHTEPDVWDGGFASIDRVLPPFLEILASISDIERLLPMRGLVPDRHSDAPSS